MIYEIGKGTGIFCSEGAGCRVYFIARPEPMLVDTGAVGRASAILRDLASISVQPIHIRKIILTHHHIGHTGALWELKRRSGAIALAQFGEPMLVQIEQTIDDDDMINGWRVIHTPGQTPGHICLFKRDCLISGDMVMASAGGFQEAPPSTIVDPVAYRASLKKIARLDYEMILPAHNPPYVVEASRHVRELVDRLET